MQGDSLRLVVTRKGLQLPDPGQPWKVNGVQGLHVCASHFSAGTRSPQEGGAGEIIGQEDASRSLALWPAGPRVRLNLYPAAGREKISVDTEVGVKPCPSGTT